jgi:hypothetical protein
MPRPNNAGVRYIILQPTLMDGVDADVWIDGVQQPKLPTDPPEQLFKYKCKSTMHSGVLIKIKVNSGTILLSQGDAYGVYCATYDNFVDGEQNEGIVPVKQEQYVQWMIPKNELKLDDSMIRIEEGDVFEYYHIIPNGPEWFDLFFTKESDKNKFKETGVVTNDMLTRCIIVIQSNHHIKDEELSPIERTEKLLNVVKRKEFLLV